MTRPKTVSGAIKGLLKAVADLEHVADLCNTRCSKNSAEISRLEGVMEADQRELTQAEAIAKKLREITEPTLTTEV